MSDADNKPLKIALTGGAGSGKSAAAARFREHGIRVVDTDQLAREVVEPGSEGLAALVAAFGPRLLTDTGELHRKRMREWMLSDDAIRRQLESLLHPLIFQALEAQLAVAEGPYAIAEIPLLVESGSTDRFDRVITVEAPEDQRIARLLNRDGIDEAAARQLIATQASETERRAIADTVLENDGDLAALYRQVDGVHDSLTRANAP